MVAEPAASTIAVGNLRSIYPREARVIEAQVCASCRFWTEETHLCRRNAPAPVVKGNEKGGHEPRARWPMTDGEDWCGEYESVLVEEEYEDEDEYDEGDEWAEDGSPAW